MQIHKLFRACGVKFKIMAVNKSTTKIAIRGSSTSGVWGHRSGLFSPHDGDSIYRKASLYHGRAVRTGCSDHRSAVGSWQWGGSRQRYNIATAPESIQTCALCAGNAINLASWTRNRTPLLPRFLCYLTSIPFLMFDFFDSDINDN